MEEYIRLEEEKDRRHGKVYNRKTNTYGKIWDNEDVHDLGSVQTKLPAIVFNDTLTFEASLSYEPTVSSLNNDEIALEFRLTNPTMKIACFHHPSLRSIVLMIDFFKDFENEFPAIVYNDAQTSKSDLLTEPILSPQHIDEVDDKTSLSECDEEEQNVLYLNDLFHFNVISLDDSKSENDNDDNKIDVKQSSRGNVINSDVGAYA
nr:hypothetical protein [Tanacetum cinerariifolium]